MNFVLFTAPAPTDLEGWKRHVARLRAEAAYVGQAEAIADAELQVELLEAALAERPVEAV